MPSLGFIVDHHKYIVDSTWAITSFAVRAVVLLQYQSRVLRWLIVSEFRFVKAKWQVRLTLVAVKPFSNASAVQVTVISFGHSSDLDYLLLPPAVGWFMWPVKTVCEVTCNVPSGTLILYSVVHQPLFWLLIFTRLYQISLVLVIMSIRAPI